MRTTDLIGKKFNNLTVIEFAYKKNNTGYWKCKCDCGNETIVMRGNLPKTLSCGCKITTNKYRGKFNPKLGHAYYNMRKRCNNPKNKSYKHYGGKGIKICSKWDTLEGFLDDMMPTYKDGLTLDRIDVNGDYCKENCRWVDRKVQNNNKTTNVYVSYKGENLTIAQLCDKYKLIYETARKLISEGYDIDYVVNYRYEKEKITYNGITKTVSEFAKDYGMTYHQLKKRLMRGWSIERALTQPLRKRN